MVHLIRDELRAPITEIYVALLGDLVDGCLEHAQEKADRDLVAEQCLFAATSLFQFVRNLSAFRPVKVVGAAVGNHGRWPNQRKMPTENRYSNFDWITMGMVEALAVRRFRTSSSSCTAARSGSTRSTGGTSCSDTETTFEAGTRRWELRTRSPARSTR